MNLVKGKPHFRKQEERNLLGRVVGMLGALLLIFICCAFKLQEKPPYPGKRKFLGLEWKYEEGQEAGRETQLTSSGGSSPEAFSNMFKISFCSEVKPPPKNLPSSSSSME
jgi:hypothetical protein